MPFCRKWSKDDDASKNANDADVQSVANGQGKRRLASRDALDGLPSGLPSARNGASNSVDLSMDEHVPHSICLCTPWLKSASAAFANEAFMQMRHMASVSITAFPN